AHLPAGRVWHLGAHYATVLHTDADLDTGQWKLIVNKPLMAGARHIWGVGVSPDGIREGATTDDPATELGRASLTMGKASSPVETLKITLSGAGGAKGKTAHRKGECDGVGAVQREVEVSRGVYSARVAAQAALGSRGVFPNCRTFTVTDAHR